MENIDRAAARERGVRIANGRGANASCVADMAMTLLSAAVTRIIPADALVREGCWDRTPPTGWPPRPGLCGQRLGIFGMGDIGQRIAVRAAAFELAVGHCNRSPRTDVDYPYFGDLTELAAWADILVIAAPASPACRVRSD
jgi:lactate dehydrogenase-like 2-hydroxyacid dehydrogenase